MGDAMVEGGVTRLMSAREAKQLVGRLKPGTLTFTSTSSVITLVYFGLFKSSGDPCLSDFISRPSANYDAVYAR